MKTSQDTSGVQYSSVRLLWYLTRCTHALRRLQTWTILAITASSRRFHLVCIARRLLWIQAIHTQTSSSSRSPDPLLVTLPVCCALIAIASVAANAMRAVHAGETSCRCFADPRGCTGHNGHLDWTTAA